jgi:hypothetical protein
MRPGEPIRVGVLWKPERRSWQDVRSRLRTLEANWQLSGHESLERWPAIPAPFVGSNPGGPLLPPVARGVANGFLQRME